MNDMKKIMENYRGFDKKAVNEMSQEMSQMAGDITAWKNTTVIEKLQDKYDEEYRRSRGEEILRTEFQFSVYLGLKTIYCKDSPEGGTQLENTDVARARMEQLVAEFSSDREAADLDIENFKLVQDGVIPADNNDCGDSAIFYSIDISANRPTDLHWVISKLKRWNNLVGKSTGAIVEPSTKGLDGHRPEIGEPLPESKNKSSSSLILEQHRKNREAHSVTKREWWYNA